MRKKKNVYDELPDYEEENEYYEEEYDTYTEDYDWEEEPAARRSGGRHVKPKAKPSRTKRFGRGLLIGLVALVLVIAIAGVVIFNHIYGMMNVDKGKDEKVPAATAVPTVTEVTPEPVASETVAAATAEPTATPVPLTEEELMTLELQKEASELVYDENVYNILLVGSDTRRMKDAGRTDAMFILSINKETKTIWLSSLQRDMWVDLPNGGTGKINSANILGGIDMLIETVENVFAVNIDNYVTVNFVDFIKLADMVGGITVTMNADEIYEMNTKIIEVNHIIGDDSNDSIIWDLVDGTYTLNGKQTLGYCRIRAQDGTAARSSRQRDALTQMWNNAKKLSILELYKIVESAMGFVTTDMTKGQCASLMLMLPNLINYDMHTQQIPVENSYVRSSVNGEGCYFLDYYVNRAYLRGTVYGQEVTEKELKSVLTKLTAELPTFD